MFELLTGNFSARRYRRMFLYAGFFLALLGILFVASVLNDVARHRGIRVVSVLPRGLDHGVYDELRDAHHNLPVDWSNLKDLWPWLDDFGMTPLLRIVCRHGAKIDAVSAKQIWQTILGFRYWMDQPGEDSHCYWSENHQILFAAAGYLAGQKYPEEVFTIGGQTGQQHMVRARRRVLTWLEHRWLYEFSEWYSNNYYVVDVGGLCNLIDFSKDDEIITKSRIILDLLIYDVATQSCQGTFVSTIGRAYERNRKSGEDGDAMRGIIQNVWGFGLPVSVESGDFPAQTLEVPVVSQ